MKHSQLHDEIIMGPSLIEILHPHDVIVLDSVEMTIFSSYITRNTNQLM